MRAILVVSCVFLSVGLLSAPLCAEEIQMAKVYRDYPGYINPAVCENPNLDKAAGEPAAQPPAAQPPAAQPPAAQPPAAQPPAAQPPAAQPPAAQPPAASAPPRQPVAPAAAPPTPASEKTPPPAVAPVAPAAKTPMPDPVAAPTPVVVNPPAAPAPEVAPAAMAKTCSSAHRAQSADAFMGPYLGVWGGVVITNDVEVNNSVDMSIDEGYGVGVAVGYDFGQVRLEVEASHRESDGDKLETNAGDVDADDDLKVSTVLVNGYVDFATGGSLTPYLGAGAGYARAELDNYDQNDDVGVAQFAAGLLMAASSQVSVDLGYRYLLPISHSDFDVEQHTAMLGLQIRF